MNEMKLPPSANRVLSMSHPILISHANLISLKKSSLSSSQRAMVKRRLSFLIEKGKINQVTVDESLKSLKKLYK